MNSSTNDAAIQVPRAVITGASSGIGRAIAVALAQGGSIVHLHARANETGVRRLADEISECTNYLPTWTLADISSTDETNRLVRDAYERLGSVDIWINNAGADVLTGELRHAGFEEKLERLWQVDVAGTIRLSRRVGRQMQVDGGGLIVNMGWDQSLRGQAGDSGELFAATKAAIAGFSLSLAKSLAPTVRVNCIAPGWIRTAWGDSASASWDQRAKDESLLGRWGTPEDVASVVQFLASPAAAFVNGQIINVNGGLSS